MPRFAFKIEYHGRPFRGWQRQNALPSVQGALEDALCKLAPERATVQGAGRTDTGVHARGQVAHVDLERAWEPFRLSEALNYHLRPAPVSILAAAEVPETFHARFSAIARHYRFRILIRRAPAALDAGLVWQVKQDLDLEAMRAGASHLLGQHDFTTFRSTMCQAKSPVKTLDVLELEEVPHADGREIVFRVHARSFLHNQVRSLVGTLERVGAGAWSPDRVKAALEAKHRAACGPVSPPQGLYLERVIYPEDPFGAEMPSRSQTEAGTSS